MADVKSEDNYKVLMGYKQRLQVAKKDAEDTKTARITGEATIKQLTKNENEVIDKIKVLGYDPDNIKNTITSMVEELGVMLVKIEQVTPDENGSMPANAKEILGIVEPVKESELIDNNCADANLDDIEL